MSENNGSDYGEFDFDARGLKPVRIPVKYDGQLYLLLELSESGKVQHQDHITSKLIIGNEGKPVGTRGGIADADALLLSLCLCETEGLDESGQPALKRKKDNSVVMVDKKKILSWPSRLVDQLTDKAKQISGLTKKKTRAEITREIENLQKELEELDRGGDKGGDEEGNLQSAGTVTSS